MTLGSYGLCVSEETSVINACSIMMPFQEMELSVNTFPEPNTILSNLKKPFQEMEVCVNTLPKPNTILSNHKKPFQEMEVCENTLPKPNTILSNLKPFQEMEMCVNTLPKPSTILSNLKKFSFKVQLTPSRRTVDDLKDSVQDMISATRILRDERAADFSKFKDQLKCLETDAMNELSHLQQDVNDDEKTIRKALHSAEMEINAGFSLVKMIRRNYSVADKKTFLEWDVYVRNKHISAEKRFFTVSCSLTSMSSNIHALIDQCAKNNTLGDTNAIRNLFLVLQSIVFSGCEEDNADSYSLKGRKQHQAILEITNKMKHEINNQQQTRDIYHFPTRKKVMFAL